MFTCEEIVKLAGAGFSPEQIVALAEVGKKEQQAPAPAAVEPQKPETKPEPITEDPEPIPQVIPPSANFPELNEAINKLNKATEEMRASAINNSNQPEKMSTDDILASIINPPKYRKEV